MSNACQIGWSLGGVIKLLLSYCNVYFHIRRGASGGCYRVCDPLPLVPVFVQFCVRCRLFQDLFPLPSDSRKLSVGPRSLTGNSLNWTFHKHAYCKRKCLLAGIRHNMAFLCRIRIPDCLHEETICSLVGGVW